MWFLRTIFSTEVLPTIPGEGVYMRVPQAGDFVAWRDLRAESRAFLTPWEPLWPSDDLTRGAFRRRLRRYARDMLRDEAYPLFLFRADDDRLLGGLTLSNVRRGICQAASLGYWMGEPHAGRGYMTAAVSALLPVAFEALGLHRIEAACMTNNLASIRLLEGVGFTREGFARQYLCINGAWEDHLLFARLRGDARTGRDRTGAQERSASSFAAQ
ncbi:GNAT family N-acetyltransferase [Aquabacter spiritensis]|uniref:[SSU ribosomal protein S5P]-alanine acetyltransferase n=1 Tax=Aquabacter spiritensis TaxID=933073 RepID=A0A4V2UX03_9HYPH|nr:GNAT family protein [Aquabacter spiritensis]TCT01588.1 [SSU ribosomal protein S5P]-alanine acetyltransferase [Aquabacter spiritensis]